MTTSIHTNQVASVVKGGATKVSDRIYCLPTNTVINIVRSPNSQGKDNRLYVVDVAAEPGEKGDRKSVV